jgi:hypothetical protein
MTHIGGWCEEKSKEVMEKSHNLSDSRLLRCIFGCNFLANGQLKWFTELLSNPSMRISYIQQAFKVRYTIAAIRWLGKTKCISSNFP